MQKPFYITVTNARGARVWNNSEPIAHNFRLLVVPETNEIVGQMCLIKACGSQQIAGSVFQKMYEQESGEWEHLKWERK